MNSENGGLSSSEKQRRTAVEIARGKVLEAYGKSESRASGQAQAVGNTAKYKENTPGKGITAEEIRLLPKGRKLCDFMLKKGWITENQ